MDQPDSSGTSPAPVSKLQSFYKKAKTSSQPTKDSEVANKFVDQTLPARYMDDEKLENELDRILGKDGWQSSKVCQLPMCLTYFRPSTSVP